MKVHSSGQVAASIPSGDVPIGSARLVAELQAATLAIQMFGLDAIRDGAVAVNQPTPKSGDDNG